MEKFNNFNLEEFEEPEKAKAIIKYLKLNGEVDTIKENESYYIINERKIKYGTSPETYKKQIEIFKTLLTKTDIKIITSIIELGDFCSEKTRNNVYDTISKKIEKKAKKRKNETDIIWLEKEVTFSVNILYNLLDKEDKDYVLCYREAWFNKKIIDRRCDLLEYEEYLVLTDDEADERAREYLEDGELWRMAITNNNEIRGLDEWIEDVLNIDGRASELNHYDGTEEYEEINGTDYYIYRQN